MKNLNDKLLKLNSMSPHELKDLKKHFLDYSLNCGLCNDCHFRYTIVTEYENIFMRFLRTERRHSVEYQKAYEFIVKHYISDPK